MNSRGLTPKNWHVVITRNMSFWHQWLSSLGHFHNSKDFGVKVPNQQLSITTNGTHTTIFLQQRKEAEYGEAVLDAISTKKKIATLKRRYTSFARELLSSLGKLNKSLTLKNWSAFAGAYQKFTAGLFLTSTIGRIGSVRLTELLKANGIPQKDIANIIGIITSPHEHTPLFRSQLDLLEIGKKVQQGAKEKQKLSLLNVWLQNHSHIPVNFCDDPWTMEDAGQQLKEITQRDCKAELVRFRKKHSKRVKEKKEILKRINNSKIAILSGALADGTYLNEFRKSIFSTVSLNFRSVFSKIAKLAGSKNWKDVFYLTSDECSELILNKKIPIKSLVNKRKKTGTYMDDNGRSHFLSKQEINSFIKAIHSTKGTVSNVSKATREIVGFSASSGKIRGTVHVVLSSKDFHKVQIGDILVTTMTSVDFVPVMEKAGAFVTNEGGITSHAAIVAREMNKPCIIATRIATKVFKDGDQVEVDANKGIVKKI